MTSEKAKMIAGAPYFPGDPELAEDRKRAQRLMRAYNQTVYGDEGRDAILSDLLGQLGEKCAIRAPLYVDYGYNITIGSGVFLNYSCYLLDAAPIIVGDGCDIGPFVQLLTADHPRDPAARKAELESAYPIVIGRDVWLGASAIILPGITVGDAAIVGAGAVVTRDVPPGATVMGNPARIREA
ncbi:Maltose O-acetyltransferase [Roseivivax sp. THAF40]|uniref:sugar O-acetyltransferase n=1 Tax=unclassified Roseivivax TaxID=2639302 RepID=UPI001267B1BA|nr:MULTISPECIES: sugar O-acetyltransferase [unclassified Roseivivax]QFS82231.1 Maltose O-acetyltransferase [Roseivivax sp. THAF197b]QFT46031.1 Maltose O-acetyltransferase [Roseivivax sp. THAF40]